MAKELAKRELNIVLVARNMAKLKKAEEAIQKVNSSCRVRSIVFDFAKTVQTQDYQTQIIDKVQDLDISILVNNVGYLQPGDFGDISLEDHKQMLDVGIIPATLLSKLLMSKML